MDELEKFIVAYLETTLPVSKVDATKLKEDADYRKDFFEQHKVQVAKSKQELDKVKDEEFEKGVRKSLSKFEKEAKEKFGVETDKKGLDLIEAILETKTSDSKPGELTEDAIKKHPVYLALEKESTKKLREVEKAAEEKVKAKEAEYAKKETFKTVEQRAIDFLKKEGIIVSENPEKASRQLKQVVRELEKIDYQPDGENILILEPDGKRKEDEHGKAYQFEKLVKDTADSLGFDFRVAQQRSSAGHTNTNPEATGKKFTGQMPKTQDDYFKIQFDEKIPIEQRLEVKEAWEKQTSNV